MNDKPVWVPPHRPGFGGVEWFWEPQERGSVVALCVPNLSGWSWGREESREETRFDVNSDPGGFENSDLAGFEAEWLASVLEPPRGGATIALNLLKGGAGCGDTTVVPVGGWDLRAFSEVGTVQEAQQVAVLYLVNLKTLRLC